ncbi:MAG: ribokinase [Gammaproteobacteria bacterium]|nr:ribokinase [Gammaproteobacteria bacterium]
MAAQIKPDLIIIGQVTVDDVVPAAPGAWRRQIGGSSLYALAGARLWLDASRIGLVARVGRDYPFDIEALLCGVGLQHIALAKFPGEHLVEWLIYEADGSRRSLPRNAQLLDVGAEGDVGSEGHVESEGDVGSDLDAGVSPGAGPERAQISRGARAEGDTHRAPASLHPYRQKLLDIAPTAEEIPPSWLPAAAIHLCPQVSTRHRDSLRFLRNSARWISVDPSPHYSRSLDPTGLAQFLEGATAFLPSAQEVRPLLRNKNPEAVALELHHAGFAEVVLKRGADPVVLSTMDATQTVPIAATHPVDPTGAGDSFCGAYAACRLLGHEPVEAARRAAASAVLVVGCSGVEAALQLTTPRV